MIPDNARTLRITAAAGTELAGASSPGTVKAVETAGSSRATEVYNPKAVIPHAASLRQPFGHCARFPTAASRRSLGRVSVPMWLAILSDQLPVVALVGRHPANELIGREPLRLRIAAFLTRGCPRQSVCGITRPLGRLSPRRRKVAHVLRTRSPVVLADPRDLHVLSTPPAFVLSQDQTLQWSLLLFRTAVTRCRVRQRVRITSRSSGSDLSPAP